MYQDSITRHSREDVVRIARAWIGTPYHHQGSVRGTGTDCLGLVRGVWRELYGHEAQPLPPYTRDWAEASGRETMLDAAERHFVSVPIGAARLGDVLIFRLRAGFVAKHAAILTSAVTMVHAFESGPAAEVPLGPWWHRRIAGAFAFPGIAD